MPFWRAKTYQQRAVLPASPSQSRKLSWVSTVIVVHNEFDAQIVFSQLEDYLEELEQHKRTKYNNASGYCEEDEDFLAVAIDRTQLMIHHLALQHPTLIRKM